MRGYRVTSSVEEVGLDLERLDEVMRGEDDPVARVELYHFAAPLPDTFYPAWIPGLPQKENSATIIRVLTEAGIEGWSAGPALGREREGLGELVGPYLVGEDATDLHGVQQRLREMTYLGWRNWWIEPAFWDIKAKRRGIPVWRLLTDDAPDSVAVYASTGEVKEPGERVEEVEARIDEGFSTVKLRIHEDEEADAAQVRRVAEAVGDRARLGVDANQGWRVAAVGPAPLWDLDRALRFAELCADLGVTWIEEPLAMDAYDDLAALTERSDVPIAGGELQPGGEAELRMMIERRCYDIFQPDAVFTGGFAQTARVAAAAHDAGLRYTPHTWTNGVGFAVNLQLFIAAGAAARGELLEYPLAPPGWVPAGRDAMLAQPFLHHEGRLPTPTGPGLGITIDAAALGRYGKRFAVMDRKRLVWFGLRRRGIATAMEIDRARRERRRQTRSG